MGTNSLVSSTGTLAWDVASNWSLGTVPQSGDDVTVTGVSSGSLSLTIASSDPAYTVNSLTETTTNPSALEFLTVAGQLTVTGSTSVTTGSLQVSGSGSLTLGSVTLSGSAELIKTGAASTLSITSLNAGTGISPGTVLVQAGSATIGSVSGAVNVSISSATATVGTTAGTSIFSLNNGVLNLQSSATSLGDSVLLSNSTNTIDLKSIAYQAGETASTALVSSGIFNYYSITLKSSQGNTLYTFQKVEGVGSANAQVAPTINLASDAASGTTITLACYAAETRIAVPGGEAPIASLAIGDLVITATGAARPIKWIGRRSYAGRFLQANPRALPIRIHAGALGARVPHRDLLVSPEHAMLIDGLLIPAGCLVNGVSIVQDTACQRIDYIHLELESHDVILAEGTPSETFVDDNSRMTFQNAQEFAALYPDAPAVAALYCAPRVDDGEALEAIRRVIDRRAGLARPGANQPLHGHVDLLDGQYLCGWAQTAGQPEAPVCLDILLDGAVVARTVANLFRADLREAGIGSGCHSFRVALPKAARSALIEVRRASDAMPLGSLDHRRQRAA